MGGLCCRSNPQIRERNPDNIDIALRTTITMSGFTWIALDADDNLFGGFDAPHHVQEITRVLSPHFETDLPNKTAGS